MTVVASGHSKAAVSTFSYDPLKRLVTATSPSPGGTITHSNYYDAAGNVLRVTRTGDGFTVTNRSATYDLAGRTLTSANALGNTTTLSETVAPITRTTAYADGGTRIEIHFLDGTLASLTGNGVFGLQNTNDFENGQFFTQETKLNTNGTLSSEWVKNFSDLAGRPVKTLYPDNAAAYTYYNSKGQRTNQVDPDGVSTLYEYNTKGELEYTVLDVNRDGADRTGSDRITRTGSAVTTANGHNVQQTKTYVWDTPADASNLVSTLETTVDGRTNWTTRFGLTTRQETSFDPANGKRTVLTIPPVGVPATNVYLHGRLISTSRGILGGSTNVYDGHGRPVRVTDARTGTTTNTFDAADRLTAVATPAPASGQSSQVTSTYYDSVGRAIRTVLPDAASVTNDYFLTGLMKKTAGARTYPVAYMHDYGGRMKTMTTWTDAATGDGAAVTTWNYDGARGWLTNKAYANGQGPSYTNTPAGRLALRKWARGTNTLYTYNNAGDLSTVDYSDPATPDVTYTYDRLGRQTTNVQGGITTSRIYDLPGNLLSEAYSGGPLSGLTVSNIYDAFFRRVTNGLLNASGTWLVLNGYAYDASNRLSVVSDRTNSATYAYLANSPLIESITFQQGGNIRMVTAKAYDNLNRLTAIVSSNSSAAVLSSFNYVYNAANQRTNVTAADSTRWGFGYDNLGQVTSAKKFWSDSTIVAGEQFEYTFDDIGNRKTAASGGDEWGANLRYENYTANNLNQYSQRTVPGKVDVIGSANANATVTVLGSAGGSPAVPGDPPGTFRTSRKGEYFRAEASATNTAGPVYLILTNIAVLQNGTNADIVTTNTGALLHPQATETFTYDLDGNTTSDSLWTNIWNAENRSLSAESMSGVPSAAKAREAWSYMPDARWIERIVSSWNGSAYTNAFTNRFVWDGQVLLAILDHTNGVALRFLRGLDLSGSEQGAGGVGGLLMERSDGNNYFAFFDGNGNVMGLASASNGSLAATYEYGPFGELVASSGDMKDSNPFRFSTKYQDDETGDLYYGYRYYRPSIGRWLNRDPLSEAGGLNLYGFVENNPVSGVDPLGLKQYTIWASAFIMPATITFPHLYPGGIDLFATWAGNGRGFGPGPLAPWYSKMAHEVVVETDPTKPAVVSNGSVGGSSTVWYVTATGPGFATGISAAPALASVSRPSRCITQVVISGSVANPLEPFAPSIDYSYTFVFDSLKGTATYSGRHDRFPWHELYVNGVSLVTDVPLGPTGTPADLIFSHTISPGSFGIPKDCCKPNAN